MNEWRSLFWPPTATRGEAIARIPTAILVIGQPFLFGLTGRLASQSRWLDGHFILLSLLPLIAAIAAVVVWWACWSRSRQLLQRADFRLCPRCRYDLSASPPEGACPECGRAYTDAALRELWKTAYRF